MDMDKFCSKCGTKPTLHSPANQETASKTEATGQNEGSDNGRGRREISQSRVAVSTAIGILLFVDLLMVIGWASDGVGHLGRPGIVFGSLAIDTFLGIFMLIGKQWARIWMLFRTIFGLVLGSIAFTLANDFAALSLLVGVCGAVILLLTGTSTRLRIGGSIALLVVLFFVGVLLSI